MDADEAVDRFDKAFGRGDVDAVMAAMTPDCVFESTSPPDGTRFVGQDEVRAAWSEFFSGTTDPAFETEDRFSSGDRVLLRWRFTWDAGDGTRGHVRGVDVITVRDGLVAEKLSYVKG